MKKSKGRPSPKRFDALCASYKALEAVECAAADNTAAVGSKLLTMVANYGDTRAEKSLALIGAEYEAIRTVGDSTKVFAHEVSKLRILMAHAGLLKEYKRMFVPEFRFNLTPQFTETLVALQERKEMTKQIRAALARAVVTTKQTPKLKVEKLGEKKKAVDRAMKKAGRA